MVSFAPTQRPLQISFHLHGQKGESAPISELDYSREELEPYMTALLQDYRAFQGGGDYADHMLPGFRIRYDDMAAEYLTGVVLPDNVPYIRGQPDDAVFLFTIVFSAGEVDTLVRSIMAEFKSKDQRYTPVPAPPPTASCPPELNTSPTWTVCPPCTPPSGDMPWGGMYSIMGATDAPPRLHHLCPSGKIYSLIIPLW